MNKDLHTPYSTVSFQMVLSDLAKYSMTRIVVRSLCDSWASHYMWRLQCLWSCCDSLVSVILLWQSGVCNPIVTVWCLWSCCDSLVSVILLWQSGVCDPVVTVQCLWSCCDSPVSVMLLEYVCWLHLLTAPDPPSFSIMNMNGTWAKVAWEPSRSGVPGSVFYVQYRQRGDWLSSLI